MDKDRVNLRVMPHALLCLLASAFLVCACSPSIREQMNIKNEIEIPQQFREKKMEKPPLAAPPKTPDFVPATADVSPLKTRIVDVIARKTSLRDVLHAIASATSLNLVMEKGVDPDSEVNMTLRNVTAEQALETVFASVDYFYRIQDNLLVVSAVATKVFELGHPAITQKYEVDVGGDILGGAMNITPSGSSGGGGGGQSASTAIKGNVSQKIKSDDTAFNFWDSIDKSLAGMLDKSSAQAATAAVGQGQTVAALHQNYTINRLTGTVHVTATKKNLQKVETYINSLKKVMSRQVIVEAKIIEVQLSDAFQFGINWTIVDRYITTTDTGASRTTSSWTYATSNFNPVATTGPVFTITGAPSFGGAKADLSLVLNALQEQGNVRTLSNPKLNIMNGQTAMLSVGRNQAYISKIESTTSTGGGASTTSYTIDTNSILSGMMIGIMPYINENGEISITITPITSNLVKFTTESVGTPKVADLQLPTVDLRQLSTTVKVRNGDIIALGGLISKTESLTDSQVPLVGNIPFLGYLFKSRDKQVNNKELVIILQPVLVNM